MQAHPLKGTSVAVFAPQLAWEARLQPITLREGDDDLESLRFRWLQGQSQGAFSRALRERVRPSLPAESQAAWDACVEAVGRTQTPLAALQGLSPAPCPDCKVSIPFGGDAFGHQAKCPAGHVNARCMLTFRVLRLDEAAKQCEGCARVIGPDGTYYRRCLYCHGRLVKM